ncbi:unnamed protein product [Linum tenue]|uniref:Uncharacterized protein n=2 Tax=Linum tenue TaxID=586396 RepID=A0AAV0PRM5_9ROSI|nr:unnamed protein product [Linum tenue]
MSHLFLGALRSLEQSFGRLHSSRESSDNSWIRILCSFRLQMRATRSSSKVVSQTLINIFEAYILTGVMPIICNSCFFTPVDTALGAVK